MTRERDVQSGDWDQETSLEIVMEEGGMVSAAPLKPLSLASLEILLAALDPRLDGFGEGPSCLDDARAFLARLSNSPGQNGEATPPPDTDTMEEWIEVWRTAGGNRETLRLLVLTLMAERTETSQAQTNRT